MSEGEGVCLLACVDVEGCAYVGSRFPATSASWFDLLQLLIRRYHSTFFLLMFHSFCWTDVF